MNLAFPALLILLYVLPGIVFANRLLLPSRQLAGSESLDWSTQVAYGAVFALPIHWMGLTIAAFLHFHFTFDLSEVLFKNALTLLEDKDTDHIPTIIKSVSHDSWEIVLYFSTTTYAAYLFGRPVGNVLASFGAITVSKSHWNDLLKSKPDCNLLVEAVVDRGAASYLYLGIYFDKIVDDNGTLRGIWLKSPSRRNLADDDHDAPGTENCYPIKMDSLFIAMDKVQTISTKQVKIDPLKEAVILKEILRKKEIELNARAIWEARKNNALIVGSPEDDWKQAELEYIANHPELSTQTKNEPASKPRFEWFRKKPNVNGVAPAIAQPISKVPQADGTAESPRTEPNPAQLPAKQLPKKNDDQANTISSPAPSNGKAE